MALALDLQPKLGAHKNVVGQKNVLKFTHILTSVGKNKGSKFQRLPSGNRFGS